MSSSLDRGHMKSSRQFAIKHWREVGPADKL